MKVAVITIDQNLVASYGDGSILGRAQKAGLLEIRYFNPRDYSESRHEKVDARPYGGGPGMVLQALPILRAVEKAKEWIPSAEILITSARGEQFTNETARSFASRATDLIIICGRYEGVDERVIQALEPKEITIGPYILTGGELPAMVMIDAIARHIPGVLGDELSVEESRVASKDTYTRPEVIAWEGKEYRVPEVLISGHHKNIEEYRKGE